jgi:hypothetical protein
MLIQADGSSWPVRVTNGEDVTEVGENRLSQPRVWRFMHRRSLYIGRRECMASWLVDAAHQPCVARQYMLAGFFTQSHD